MTKNMLYRGDNLMVMQGLDSGIVDLIITDPPFNTKKPQKTETASYRDTWKWTDVDEYWLAVLATKVPGLAAYIASLADSGYHKSMQAYAAFMAPRLYEMWRLLKETGSMYLHCDWHAAPVLWQMMIHIFGERNFRNDIIWCYTGPGNVKRWFKRKHDIILYFVKSPRAPFYRDEIRTPYKRSVTSWGVGGFASGKRTFDEVQRAERIALKKGKVMEDWWHGIPAGGQISKKERVGYPTQKPLKLIYPMLAASSKPGDVVLDGFSGCVTVPIAAELRERRWIAIDLWEEVRDMMLLRMDKAVGIIGDYEFIDTISGDPMPKRMDVEPCRKNQASKDRLMLEQKGKCNGCKCDLRGMSSASVQFDRIIPGDDVPGYVWGNMQLLCIDCNLLKRDKPMDYLLRELDRRSRRRFITD